MTNSWMNEDGEPIMDGAAWRFEQQLDAEAAEERLEIEYMDAWQDDAPCESDPDDCDGADLDGNNDGTWECHWCGKEWGAPAALMEDQWLDGSYEE